MAFRLAAFGRTEDAIAILTEAGNVADDLTAAAVRLHKHRHPQTAAVAATAAAADGAAPRKARRLMFERVGTLE